jgi:hypothetical protein
VKKALKWIAVAFGVVILLCCGTVLLLPKGWEAQASIVIDAPPEKIYPYVAQPRKWVMVIDRYAQKQPDYEQTTFTYTFGDVREGPGAWWISESEGPAMKSKVRIEYTKGGPAEGLWYDGMIESDEVNGHGSVLFEKVDGGTKVTWDDGGTVSLSMGGGLAAMAIGPMLEPFFQGTLQELKDVVENDIEIVDAE